MLRLFVCLVCVTMVTGLLFSDEEEMIEQPWADVDPKGLELADANDCEFFKYFSKRYPCSRRLLEIGLYPTCIKMTNRKQDMNEQGQQWLTNSRRCFYTQLKVHYQSDSLACLAFRDTAVNAYMSCADTVAPNMCQIFYSNRRVISDVLNITLEKLLDNPRLGVKNIFGLARMMSGCADDQVRSYLNEIKVELTRVLRRNIKFPWE